MTNPPDHAALRRRATLLGAGVGCSIVAGGDVFFDLFCLRFPLFIYLTAALIGAAGGRGIAAWTRSRPNLQRPVQFLALGLCVLGVMSASYVALSPPNWSSKCAFRYCGRGLSGLSLGQSPYPVGFLDCGNLHLCANEYRLSPAQRQTLYERIEALGEHCDGP